MWKQHRQYIAVSGITASTFDKTFQLSTSMRENSMMAVDFYDAECVKLHPPTDVYGGRSSISMWNSKVNVIVLWGFSVINEDK